MTKYICGILFLIVFLFSSPRLSSHWALNQVAIFTLQSYISNTSLDLNNLPLSLSVLPCRAHWLLGFIAQSRDDQTARDAAWRGAIQCDPGYIRLLHKIVPEDRTFAEYAIHTQSDAAEGWFWLAELEYAVLQRDGVHSLSEQEREFAIANLKEGLQRDPSDGLRWRELGDLLRQEAPRAAIDAYLQSCFNGDPGYNGCWLAGHVALEIGEIENAIRYYRYSQWEAALDRAYQLEAQLNNP